MVSVVDRLKVVSPEDEPDGHGWPERWTRKLDHEWYGVRLPAEEVAAANKAAKAKHRDLVYRVLSRTGRTLGFFATEAHAVHCMDQWPMAAAVAFGTKIVARKTAEAEIARAA